MAEFLITRGIAHRLEEIIKNAAERLVIISPFLRIPDDMKALLEDQDRMKIDIRVIYGKNELQPEENNWLESMTSIRTSFCKNLHAKCYLNENEALLTSMNLYEFSLANNNEMGILVTREHDPELYDKIYQESMRLVRISDEVRVTVARIVPPDGGREPSEARKDRQIQQTKPTKAFCIRCKADIPADPVKPYCRNCYTSWNRYKNNNYEEKHCHTCGNDHTATLLKPLCRACYRRYKDVVEFVV